MMNHNLSTTCVLGVSSSAAEQDRLARILDEYLVGLERGEPVSPDELLARHPELADRLRGYLSGLSLFHKAVALPVAEPVTEGRGFDGLELGDFRLVREIGRGGMGIVYEAIQMSLGRRVAVKMLPMAAAVDEKQIARFKNEAQAAAQVDHPNIVPVFAIGQQQGIHYFAMQLIVGKSLSQLLGELRTESHEAATLTTLPREAAVADRTQQHLKDIGTLGIQAAEALHAVHEIGVVHRDIKPSNLLLDEKHKLWVTDFGVARCRSNVSLTETGHALGTMRYMSPEQALGQTAMVDHRTDIYSLGVTLYELAVLRHPFEDVADAALAFEFGRANLRSLRHWNRFIPADFENIILKAMADAREDRYATAQDLADDLKRFLDGQPTQARRPSLSVRAGRWARRHRRSVVAAVGTMVLAMAGLTAGLFIIAAERADKEKAYQTAKANHERAEASYAQAQTKFRQAREMLDRFGSGVAQKLADVAGAESVRKELLAEMLPYYRSFAEESIADPAVQADLALTLGRIGFLSDELGAQKEALAAYEDAKAILQKLVAENPENRTHTSALALCCNNIGQLLQKRGDFAGARQNLERARALQQQLVKAVPESHEFRRELARTYSNLGMLWNQAGKKQTAAEQYRRAIALQEELVRGEGENPATLHDLASSYNNLSALFLSQQPATARQWVERAMALQIRLVRQYPDQRDYQSDLALSYNNLGAIHSRLSHWTESTRCYEDAIALQQHLVAESPLEASYRRDLSVSYNNLGMVQSAAGSLVDSERSFSKALELRQELAKLHPQDLGLLSGLAGIYNNLGMVQKHRGNLAAAATAFEKAIDAQKRVFQHAADVTYFREALSKHYFNYAQVLRQQDRPDAAATAMIERRNLWTRDADRLVRIAEEMASLARQQPAGDIRQRLLHETAQTLHVARAAGLKKLPDFTDAPFDVLSQDASLVTSEASTTPLDKASEAETKAEM